jgi:hypothetical protein
VIVTRFPSLLLQRFAAAALAALGFCALHARADEPSPSAPSTEQVKPADLLAVLQQSDDGPRRGPEGGARSGGPDRRPDEGARPGQRGRGGGDRPPPGDRPGQRGPGDRPPGDRGPGDRGPVGPPRGPQGQSGPGSLDARIARLEQKLDTVLNELRELRRDRTSPRYADRGPGPRPGYGSFGMRGGAPRPPMGPPPFDREWRDGDRFGPPARRMDGPPPEWRREPTRWEGPSDRPRAERDRRDRDDDLSF